MAANETGDDVTQITPGTASPFGFGQGGLGDVDWTWEDPGSNPIPIGEWDMIFFIVYGCVMGVLNTLGIVTNSITIYVFTKYPTKSSTYLLLQVMALADSLFLLFSILKLSVKYIYIVASPARLQGYLNTFVYALPYFNGFHEISRDFAVWMVVLVTIDRYIGICHALKAPRINTLTHAIVTSVGLCLAIILYNVPMFMMLEVVDEGVFGMTYIESELGKNRMFCSVYFSVDAILNLLIPIILVIAMNSAIVNGIRKAGRRRIPMTQQSNDNSRSHHRTNIMLVIVAILFVLCELPKIAEQIFYFTKRDLTAEEYKNNIPYSVAITSEFLQNFNSFVNFYIYCLVGKKFQRILADMGCRGCVCFGRKFGLKTSWDNGSVNKTSSIRLTSISRQRQSV